MTDVSLERATVKEFSQVPDSEQAAVYQIKVRGELDESWSDWFGGMAIACERTHDGPPLTTLTGTLADQPALLGILVQIGNLNLTLISVARIEADA